MNKNNLREETRKYIQDTPLKERKDMGQYFTPLNIQKKVFENLPDTLYNKKDLDILDPSSGTGEFLYTCKEKFTNPNLYGWELDEELVDISRKVVPEADIKQTNTLLEDSQKKYDLIIGNPPYYEFQPSKEIKNRYEEVMYGRTNIYGLFIYKSIKNLKSNGYLGFVNPPSMNNGAYFSKLREYIMNNCNIEYLSVLDNTELFEGADQPVMIMILKKGNNKNDYVFQKGSVTIFSEKASYLKNQFKDKKSLDELGFTVKTGSLVWNKNKGKLTNNPSKTLVVYSHNITEDGLQLKTNKSEKKQYVDIKNGKVNHGPAILVNRVVGKPGSGNIRAIKMPENKQFVAENHVNVIKPTDKAKIDLNEVLKQLNNSENVELLQSITGNSQLSKTELQEIFPINC